MISTLDSSTYIRYDTKENWELYNPILDRGELAVEVVGTSYNLKCGNGSTDWNNLKYISFSESSEGNNYFDNGYIQLNADGSASFANGRVTISSAGILTASNSVVVKDVNGVTIESKEGKVFVGGVDITEGTQGKDGKSAYEIWLDLGNEGSESDFIESLKGEDGSLFAFQVEEGYLMLYYQESTIPPNFELSAEGELFLNIT